MTELTLLIFGQTVLGSTIVLLAYNPIKDFLKLTGTAATIGALIFGGLLGVGAYYLNIVVGGPFPLVVCVVQGFISALGAMGFYDKVFRKK